MERSPERFAAAVVDGRFRVEQQFDHRLRARARREVDGRQAVVIAVRSLGFVIEQVLDDREVVARQIADGVVKRAATLLYSRALVSARFRERSAAKRLPR